MLVSGALSALPSMYPNQFAHHPTTVWASLIVGICLVLVGGLTKVLSRIHGPEIKIEPPTAAKSVQAKSEVGHIEQKEIGAHATGNQVNLYFSGNATQPLAAPLAPESVSQRSGDALGTTPDMPALELQFCEARVNSDNEKVIHFDKDGKKCLTISVLNRAAPLGKQAFPARSVCASLEFIALPGGRRSMVNRAVWIGQDANEIYIDVNDTAHILVGLPSENEWMTFNNSNRISAREKEYWAHGDFLEPRPMDWFPNVAYEVDVKVISGFNPTKGQTLAHRAFELRRGDISFTAKWIPPPPTDGK